MEPVLWGQHWLLNSNVRSSIKTHFQAGLARPSKNQSFEIQNFEVKKILNLFLALNVILTDFSNEACEMQADRFLNVQSKYKKAGLGDDILVDNNSSLGSSKNLKIANFEFHF